MKVTLRTSALGKWQRVNIHKKIKKFNLQSSKLKFQLSYFKYTLEIRKYQEATIRFTWNIEIHILNWILARFKRLNDKFQVSGFGWSVAEDKRKVHR